MQIQIKPAYKEEFIVLNSPFKIEYSRVMFPEKLLALFLGKDFEGSLSKNITDNIFVFNFNDYSQKAETGKYLKFNNEVHFFEAVLECEYNEYLINKNTVRRSNFNISRLNELILKSETLNQIREERSKGVDINLLNKNLNEQFDDIEKKIVELSDNGKWHLVKWLELTINISEENEDEDEEYVCEPYEQLVDLEYDFKTTETYKFYIDKFEQHEPIFDEKYYVIQQTIEYIKYMFPENHIESFYNDENNVELMIKF